MKSKPWLILGGILSMAVAALHIGVIFAGAPAYRYFGAGEDMASMAEAGSILPALVTTGLVIIFIIWGLYAFSGAGLIRRLPLLRLGLCVIAGIYTLRGIGVIPQAIWMAQSQISAPQDIVSSLVSLFIGIIHFVGIREQSR